MPRRSRLLPCLASLCVLFWVVGCVVTPMTPPGSAPQTAVYAQPKSTKTEAPAVSGPTEIGASHLLVQYQGAQGAAPTITRTKAEALARAEQALARARAGEPFATLVAEYSDEPGAAERAGSLGKFDRQTMVPAFSDAAFRLKVGAFSDVVETPFGYHVIVRTE
jgi:peptidyl-prolyl cis-trans isomerase NIMA-interacting 1